MGAISTILLLSGLVLSGIGLVMIARRNRTERPATLSPTTGSALDTTLYHLIKDISREPIVPMVTRAPRGTPAPSMRPSTLSTPADAVHSSRFAAVARRVIAPPFVARPIVPPPRAQAIDDNDFSEDAPTLVAGAYVVSVSPSLPLEVHERSPRRRRTRTR